MSEVLVRGRPLLEAVLGQDANARAHWSHFRGSPQFCCTFRRGLGARPEGTPSVCGLRSAWGLEHSGHNEVQCVANGVA
jgi:hypothetical protein